jgi:hypothetical protein
LSLHSIQADKPGHCVATVGLAAPNSSRTIYVEVSGGVVQAVQNLPERCNCIVLDWDSFESDPVATWERTDEQTRQFIQKEYPDSYGRIIDAINAREKVRR